MSDGVPCFVGISTPLIRPLNNSSVFRSEHGAGTANYEGLTFGPIIEIQARKPLPTHYTYLRRVRGGISHREFRTGEPTKRFGAGSTLVNAWRRTSRRVSRRYRPYLLVAPALPSVSLEEGDRFLLRKVDKP